MGLTLGPHDCTATISPTEPSLSLLPPNFETGFHVVQAGNFWSSCLHLLSAATKSVLVRLGLPGVKDETH